jgi:hypothetical protein
MINVGKYTTFKTINYAKNFLEIKTIDDLIVFKEKIKAFNDYVII